MIKIKILLLILVCFTLEGISQTMPTIGQVYDFNINDEFHYFTNSIANQGKPNATRIKIIGKHFSSLNDTVFYVRHFNNYYTEYNAYPTPHLDYIFTVYNDTVSYTKLDSLIDTPYHNWVNNTTTGDLYSDTLYYSTTYCGRLIYEYFKCIGCVFEGHQYNFQYGKGLGLVLSTHQTSHVPQIDDWYELRYYKKDTIQCGIADTTQTSIIETENTKANIIVYPNPASNEITINTGSFKDYQLSIFNAMGQCVMLQCYKNPITTINIEGFNQGIYLYKIEDKSGKVINGKFIKQ